MAKPTTVDRLAAVRAELAATSKQIDEMTANRNARLLADDDVTSRKLLKQVDELRQHARGLWDKASLLEAEVEREEVERVAKERADLIARIEVKIAERDAAGADLAAAIKGANDAFRRMIDIGREIATAWNWPVHDMEPIAVIPDAVVRLIRTELFRIGSAVTHAGLGFPGSKAPSLDLLNNPTAVMPLVDALAEASALASQIMRTGRSTSGRAIPPVEGVPTWMRADRTTSPAEANLARLLSKQAELALDLSDAGQRAYEGLMKEIVEASGAVETGKEIAA